MCNIQQSKTVMETYSLSASLKLTLLRHFDRLYQWALLQWIRCLVRLFALLTYSVKPFTNICLRFVENTVVCVLWISFRNFASLSKSVFKWSLCYVDQTFFWSVGGARGRERTDFEQAYACWPLYFWFVHVTPNFFLQSARVISLWEWLALF